MMRGRVIYSWCNYVNDHHSNRSQDKRLAKREIEEGLEELTLDEDYDTLEEIGMDGLTDTERKECAKRYWNNTARRTFSDAEKAAIVRVVARRSEV